MSGHWTDLFSFVSATVRAKDIVYVVLSTDEAEARKQALSGFVQWSPEGWGDGGQVNWRTAGIAVVRKPLTQLIAVGEQGGVLLLGSGDRHEEVIATKDSKPTNRGPLRGVCCVDDQVLVVGMDRQVYRRTALNQWATFDQGLPRPGKGEVCGFEAIDGSSLEDLTAVGWDGEIWHFDGKTWKPQQSPTDAVLVEVRCAGADAYACGRRGLLLKRQAGKWKVLPQKGFTEDLWSLAWFNQRLYASSMNGVFELKANELTPVDMGKDPAKTWFRLCAGDGVLWSIGAKDLMCFNGKRWTRID